MQNKFDSFIEALVQATVGFAVASIAMDSINWDLVPQSKSAMLFNIAWLTCTTATNFLVRRIFNAQSRVKK